MRWAIKRREVRDQLASLAKLLVTNDHKSRHTLHFPVRVQQFGRASPLRQIVPLLRNWNPGYEMVPLFGSKFVGVNFFRAHHIVLNPLIAQEYMERVRAPWSPGSGKRERGHHASPEVTYKSA